MSNGLRVLTLLCIAPAAIAQELAGVWNATINFDGIEIPFRIGFSGNGTQVRGWFFNGDEKVPGARPSLLPSLRRVTGSWRSA